MLSCGGRPRYEFFAEPRSGVEMCWRSKTNWILCVENSCELARSNVDWPGGSLVSSVTTLPCGGVRGPRQMFLKKKPNQFEKCFGTTGSVWPFDHKFPQKGRRSCRPVVLSFIWCFYTFCLTFGHWTFHGFSKDWAATLVADGARKSCFAAIFIGHIQFASSLELCDTGGVNMQEVPLCLVNFWVCFSNPNLFCAQMQGTSNDGDPGCSGEWVLGTNAITAWRGDAENTRVATEIATKIATVEDTENVESDDRPGSFWVWCRHYLLDPGDRKL